MKPSNQSLDDHAQYRARQLLANYPLLNDADDASVSHLLRHARLESVPAGAALVSEDQSGGEVFFLLEGVARSFHTSEDGRQFTAKLLTAPNHFGDLDMLSARDSYDASIEAVEPCVVARVNWRVVRELLANDHALALAWLAGLASQAAHTVDADRHNVFGGLSGRIANMLLSYADVFGRPTDEGVEIAKEISRETLARDVGSVKRSVVRVIGEFSERGWLETRGTRLLLKDLKRIEAQALPGRVGLSHTTGV